MFSSGYFKAKHFGADYFASVGAALALPTPGPTIEFTIASPSLRFAVRRPVIEAAVTNPSLRYTVGD